MARIVRYVLATIGVLLLVAAVAVSSFPRYFASFTEIQKVQLTGEVSHISPVHLERALGDTIAGTFFDIDVNAIRDAALKAPWVKDVRVRRIWPDTVRLEIREHRAIALWEDGRLVGVEGELFAANPEEADNPMALPEFFGRPDMAAEVTRRYKRFTQMLKTVMPRARITELSVTDRDSWTLAIASDTIKPTRIELGTERAEWSLEDRFAVVIVHYGDVAKLMKGAPSSIDARYENAFSATLPERTMQKLHTQGSRRQAAEAIAERNRH